MYIANLSCVYVCSSQLQHHRECPGATSAEDVAEGAAPDPARKEELNVRWAGDFEGGIAESTEWLNECKVQGSPILHRQCTNTRPISWGVLLCYFQSHQQRLDSCGVFLSLTNWQTVDVLHVQNPALFDLEIMQQEYWVHHKSPTSQLVHGLEKTVVFQSNLNLSSEFNVIIIWCLDVLS